jgi:hypothetical protein
MKRRDKTNSYRLIDPFEAKGNSDVKIVHGIGAVVLLIVGIIGGGAYAVSQSPIVSLENQAEGEIQIDYYDFVPLNLQTVGAGLFDATGSYININPTLKLPEVWPGDPTQKLTFLGRTATAEKASGITRIEGKDIGVIEVLGTDTEINSETYRITVDLDAISAHAELYKGNASDDSGPATLITVKSPFTQEQIDTARSNFETLFGTFCKLPLVNEQDCQSIKDKINDAPIQDAKASAQLEAIINEKARKCLANGDNLEAIKTLIEGYFKSQLLGQGAEDANLDKLVEFVYTGQLKMDDEFIEQLKANGLDTESNDNFWYTISDDGIAVKCGEPIYEQ